MKKIIVDPDRCIRCGACVSMCDSVFQFSDEGYAETKEENNIFICSKILSLTGEMKLVKKFGKTS